MKSGEWNGEWKKMEGQGRSREVKGGSQKPKLGGKVYLYR